MTDAYMNTSVNGGSMVKILATIVLVLVFSFNATAAEKKKLHPELSDPVLGDRAAVVEWAWSPQYAKRFGIPAQNDGLKDGALWLIGVKVQREQFKDYQSYKCSIVGIFDNKTPIVTPPGDMYVRHPSDNSVGGFPGQVLGADSAFANKERGMQTYTPLQAAWWKLGKMKPEPVKPKSNITIHYNLFHRYFVPDLAFFELDGGCAYFENPLQFRNEIRFHELEKSVKPNSPINLSYPIAFSIPDSLMQRIYPYTNEAASWTQCFMRRIRGKSSVLRMGDKKRFGNSCEPITDIDINR